MALAWTTADDVKGRWVGEALTATDAQILVLLEDAEDTVLREFPDLQTRINRAEGSDTTEGPSVPQRRVQKVVARIVMRHLRNPEGFRQTQEGAGPFQQTTTFGGAEPGSLYLTDEDRADLGGVRRGGAFTIDATPADAMTDFPTLPWAATLPIWSFE